MAYRRVVRWAVDEAGNVIGGTGYEGRLYLANSLTLATIYLDSAGATTVPNPHSPNTGQQTSSSANMLTTDVSIAVLSTTGFAVGDLVPIDGSAGRFFGVIKVVTDGTHLQFTQTLAQMGGVATMNSGALVGGPEMVGHWEAFALDTSDYDFTLKNLATGKEGPPEGVATLSTAGTVNIQEEGAAAGTRPTVNLISAYLTAVDNGGANRVDVTGPTSAAPAASAVGDTAVTGASGTIADALHKHAREAFAAVVAFAYAAANGVAATLARSDHNHGLALTTASANLASDVAMSGSIGTFYDSATVSLAAGTWFIVAKLTTVAGGADKFVSKLWDGTTVVDSTEKTTVSAGLNELVNVGIVTLGGTTTYKQSVCNASGTTGTLKAATVDNGSGNHASSIRAVRIA